ncbi:PREDICTED: cysteine/serine-rich nuclear protein 1 [Elephantulus edwardii]|uniref:cysteine/serine-rich nuclear protein 1 n=1 Tax=Elephantulus edwardii TaxID=28737 RepID=UPI0003F07964|nr:PREDICTED: cysteine/serine-rich nuclear protein 1 [Elephantulus edwardii]
MCRLSPWAPPGGRCRGCGRCPGSLPAGGDRGAQGQARSGGTADCPQTLEHTCVTMKRKFEQLDEDSFSSSSGCHSRSCSPSFLASPAWNLDEEVSLSQTPLPDFTPPSILKRLPRGCRRQVSFDGITVYYFPRCQGFTSVPSYGGCTLGMAPRHSTFRSFSLAEFAQEQALVRREKLRQRLKEEKLDVLRRRKLSATRTSEAEEDLPLTVDDIDDASVEEDLAVAIAEGQLEEGTFLQPFPPRRRRALLRAAGVRKIDREEKRELLALRQSREDCGCHCDKVCDPETCSCSLAGIKCQMDHTSFPCGCCREGCENPNGRVEFNQARVQTHFIHTLTRLQLEQGAESLVELEAPAQDGAPSSGEQALAPPFPLAKPSVSSELSDTSCSSDMSDSSTVSSPGSGTSEAPGSPAHSPLPGPASQPDLDDDSLVRILSFSDSDLGRQEEEEEEGMGHLDNLNCFHPADMFGTGDLGGLAGWTHSYSGSSLSLGILDENANLDAGSVLNGGLDGTKEASLPGTPGLGSAETGQSSSGDLSLSSCDSFELFQALPDYSLGPLYTSRKAQDNVDTFEAPCFPLPGLSPPRDTGLSFLESFMSFSEPAEEALTPLIDSQLFEDAAPAPLVEPVPV